MKEIPKTGDRGFVFGKIGTVLEVTDELISFEVDAYKNTTRPIMVVPTELFERI